MSAETKVKMPRAMKEFYQQIGLRDYPFNIYTAENEAKYAAEIFIHPQSYDAIKESFDSGRSIIVRGNRGTGKTALLNDLQKPTTKSERLICVIDDYSQLSIPPISQEYYKLIIARVTDALFTRLFDEKHRLKRLNKEEKLFLSLLLDQYTSQVTQSELIRKIESLQLSGIKRFIKSKINLIRAILNYGITAGLNVINDAIRNYLTYLPPIDESQIRDIMPTINFNSETTFSETEASYHLILRICGIVDKLGFGKVTVFFDKFDEDGRMENDAEKISEFISPLLVDNKLLENRNIQLIISVWEVPFKRLMGVVRTQKHYCPLLEWSTLFLMVALNKRLTVFSDGIISDFHMIFNEDVDDSAINEIVFLSNGNPRDLWHIINYIFQCQYSIDDNSTALTKEAIYQGLNEFVVRFNFYEYYPKKPKAKASTMDVYSYIKHLLKLSSETFTKNQLNEAAKIGSSTNNYVVGMENIGLVVNTKEKVHGGVLYRINDPKVVYAIKNHLDISR